MRTYRWHTIYKKLDWLIVLPLLVLTGCEEEIPCSRFDVERNRAYKAPANGKVWTFSNAAICTIYVNNVEVASDKGTSTLVKRGDIFRVTKSQVNIPHTFQSWFDCEE